MQFMCPSSVLRPYLSAFSRRFDSLAPFRVFDFASTMVQVHYNDFLVCSVLSCMTLHHAFSRDLVLLYQAAMQPYIYSSFVLAT